MWCQTYWYIHSSFSRCCVMYIKRYQSPDFRMKITPSENASVLSVTWNRCCHCLISYVHNRWWHRRRRLHDSWNVYTRFSTQIRIRILNGWRVRACAVRTSNHKIGKKYVYTVMNWWRHHCRANKIVDAPATLTTLNTISKHVIYERDNNINKHNLTTPLSMYDDCWRTRKSFFFLLLLLWLCCDLVNMGRDMTMSWTRAKY